MGIVFSLLPVFSAISNLTTFHSICSRNRYSWVIPIGVWPKIWFIMDNFNIIQAVVGVFSNCQSIIGDENFLFPWKRPNKKKTNCEIQLMQPSYCHNCLQKSKIVENYFV